MQLSLIYGQITMDMFLYGLTGYADNNFAEDFTNQKLVIG